MWESKVLNTSKDQELWKRLVNNLPVKDVYFTPEYGLVFEATKGETRKTLGGEALLFFYGNEQNYIIYPFLRRSISELPFSEFLPSESEGWFDIISPYGYSGPLAYVTELELEGYLWEKFLEEFHDYCLEAKIVTEFARLHPYIRNDLPLSKLLDIEKRPKVVYIDLEQEEAAIKRGMSRGNKSSISKARHSGVRILYLNSEKEPGSFHQLYTHTMERNKAKEIYYFSREFFDNLFKLLEGSVKLFEARYQGRLIAAVLLLIKHNLVHYYLGASDTQFLHLRPNNLLFYEAILWAKKQGYKIFDLGGGYEPNDSLFQFKNSFSKTTADFYTYSKVHNQEMYKVLCQARDKYDRLQGRKITESSYFPQYRR